ncbi:unnamed protein product [Mycena citricolor]|uniref:Derlin n=1 Tax=Mycena citricolor TaxID=2018698 RepID=A0AAD2HCW5_9AGAR|nr:unnamed protein product [Mycena citricolor]CAK5272538.1 unnamed protein product [Mycena citricolor]
MSEVLAEIRKIPPVTRLLCISSVSVSLSSMMGLVSPYKVVYTYKYVFRDLQVWRLYTSFFLGGSGINYIFDLVMLYRSADQLESGPYQGRSADLAWQLFASCVAIIITSIPVKSLVFFRPLLLCLAYVSSALAPVGAQTSIMGLISVPITYFPYIFLGMDLLMGGPGAVAQSLPGAVVGHLWWWGVWGPNTGGEGGILAQWGAAPRWLREWMGQRDTSTSARTAAGTSRANAGSGIHIVPPRRPAESGASTSTSGYNWGTGQKLGSQ